MKYGLRPRRPPATPCAQCAVRKMALFRHVPLDRLEWTQEYRTQQYVLEPKQHLYHEGDPPYELYTIYSGWVKLYKVLENGKKQVLRFALPGDFIGFQSDLEGPLKHTAVALTQCILCAFPKARLAELFRGHQQLSSELLMIHARDMGLCHEHLLSTGARSARERIAFLLLELYHRLALLGHFRADTADEKGLKVPITQEDIAEACGLTAIHVNRTLKQMRDERLISCANGHLVVMNEQALNRIAHFDPKLLERSTLI